MSVQLLFEFIDQFLIVGLNAKISVPCYWTVFSVFARDLIFQCGEQSSVARWNKKFHERQPPRMRKASGIFAVESVSARFVEAAHTESRLPRINTPHAKGGFWPEYVRAAIVYTEQLREGLITGMLPGGGGVRLNGRSEQQASIC